MGRVVSKYHYKSRRLSSFKKKSSEKLPQALLMTQISKEDCTDFWTISELPIAVP
jgi:hypothetical protein